MRMQAVSPSTCGIIRSRIMRSNSLFRHVDRRGAVVSGLDRVALVFQIEFHAFDEQKLVINDSGSSLGSSSVNVICARKPSSFASPMPLTSKSSSAAVKSPVLGAIVDDRLRKRRADARERFQLRRVGGIDVYEHARGRGDLIVPVLHGHGIVAMRVPLVCRFCAETRAKWQTKPSALQAQGNAAKAACFFFCFHGCARLPFLLY